MNIFSIVSSHQGSEATEEQQLKVFCYFFEKERRQTPNIQEREQKKTNTAIFDFLRALLNSSLIYTLSFTKIEKYVSQSYFSFSLKN